MQVNFYTFAKKKNSLAVPSTVGQSFNCKAIQPCGVLNPVISVDMGSTGNPTAYNYAYISDFGRYYWITDWQTNIGFWTAYCKVDSLATYRGAIMAESAMVVRSASDYDSDLVDTLYPAKGAPTQLYTDKGSRWLAGTNFNTGTLVAGIVGKDTVNYYAFSSLGDFDTFFDHLMDDATLTGTLDAQVLQECTWLKGVVNPLQFFQSITWIPLNNVGIGTSVNTINVGYYINLTTPTAIKITQPLYGTNWTIDIPKHPQATDRGAWLNASGYSIYDYYYPALGSYRLNSADLANETSLTVQRDIDVRSGTCRVVVKQTSGGKVLLDTCAVVGVPMMLAQSNPTMDTATATGAANWFSQTFGSFNPVNLATGIVSSYERAIAMAVADQYGQATTINSNGAVTGLTGTERLTGTFFELTEDATADRGRPLCKIKTLSALSGYCELLEGDLPLPATDAEMDEIRSYLVGGFYIE